ncbi:branched-chain amino acid ABC transporter permease [Bradyrhizobium sp. 187]|uniref:branched-chain amino acid ABC transporter permease n=1 Tax=Bradyrhizobium sp. 187 TaxID=2782655 RepID=UPI001FFE509B|nr:branched-chain amino acid ABC transporter permease [Bradyrhizobium sp. 187]UPJ71856.1 branched-chain amino acid ABC transporter permease [Bradyrhizobium sp. 187]
MQFWIVQSLNSLALGGVLFLLSAGFSLIFGLMRIPNLAHGALFLLGSYLGVTLVLHGVNFILAAVISAVGVGLMGSTIERLVLRGLAGNEKGQVLVTLGFSYIIADVCLVVWGGDPIAIPPPSFLRAPISIAGLVFPSYRLAVFLFALFVGILLHLLLERTRLGAMIRAGVDDMEMARGVGIRISNLFTAVFLLGAACAGLGGVVGAPILSAYPGLDLDMLPLALVVVVLGGVGQLAGALIGSIIVGFVYTFGTAMFPDLAYVILFLPMVFALVVRPQGLLGGAHA